jgi:hypothetical protein
MNPDRCAAGIVTCMRLPLSKVYRAFPELDRFSDQECEQFVLRAEQDYPGSKGAAQFLGAGGIAVGLIVVGVIEKILWTQYAPNWSVGSRADFRDGLILLSAVLMVLSFCVGMLMVRDRWLIRTITLRVQQTSCPGCGYSLLGLAVDRGVVTCPECAAPFHLSEHGLRAEDLIAPRSA